MDIKESKEAVSGLAGVVKAFKDAKADGHIGLEDLALLPALIGKLGPAFEGSAQIPAELKDLSPEELGELSAFIVAEFAVDDEKSKAIIEGAFQAFAGIAKVALALKA